MIPLLLSPLGYQFIFKIIDYLPLLFQPPVKKSTKSPVKATKPEKSPSKPPAATKGDTLLILDDCKSNMSSCNY